MKSISAMYTCMVRMEGHRTVNDEAHMFAPLRALGSRSRAHFQVAVAAEHFGP